jgi:predicted nucleic acid-binding protein
VRAYVADQEGHAQLRRLLLEGDDPVVTSELAQVELASVVRAAERAGRLREADGLLARIEADCAEDGPLTLLVLRPNPVLGLARRLLDLHRLRTLDAIHLAVALEDGRRVAGDEQLQLVTRDEQQRGAALAAGLAVQ